MQVCRTPLKSLFCPVGQTASVAEHQRGQRWKRSHQLDLKQTTLSRQLLNQSTLAPPQTHTHSQTHRALRESQRMRGLVCSVFYIVANSESESQPWPGATHGAASLRTEREGRRMEVGQSDPRARLEMVQGPRARICAYYRWRSIVSSGSSWSGR